MRKGQEQAAKAEVMAGVPDATGAEPAVRSNFADTALWSPNLVTAVNGIATFSARGSGFDTLLDVYTGTNFNNLTTVVTYDDQSVSEYFSNGDLWVSFDGARVVQRKLEFAARSQLLGYFLWTVGFDDSNSTISRKGQ